MAGNARYQSKELPSLTAMCSWREFRVMNLAVQVLRGLFNCAISLRSVASLSVRGEKFKFDNWVNREQHNIDPYRSTIFVRELPL